MGAAADDAVDRALAAAARHPDRPSVITPDGPVLFACELPRRAAAQAAFLASVAGPDEPIVALVGFDAVGPTLTLASAMADRQITLADVDGDPQRIVDLVRSLGSIAIADERHAEVIAALPDDIRGACFDATAEADPAGPWSRPPGERMPRVLSTTSGTTGAPKAARLPADRWGAANAATMSDEHRACRLSIAAIGSYAFVIDCVKVSTTGGTAAMINPASASMRDIVAFCETARVTSLSVTSTFTTAAVRATAGRALDCDISLLNVRGERVTGDHLAHARKLAPIAAVSAQYASTELGSVARLKLEPTDPLPQSGRSVAMPLEAGVAVRFVGPDGAIVDTAPDGPAELVVRPKTLFEGYVGRPDDRIDLDGERWFRTGDLGELTEDGRLLVYGRTGRRVKVGGQFVDLDDVAAAFEAVDGIALAAVTAFDDDRTNTTRLVGHVVPEDGVVIDPVAVRAGLAERLPIFMVPSLIHVVDDPPMARTGKLDVEVLRAWRPAATERPRVTRGDYSSPDEAVLQVVAAELLDAPVGPDDDLINAGMTSLDWLELQTRLSDDFGVEVSLPELYAAPTVRAIARLLGDGREVPALVRLRAGDQLPSLVWVLLGLGAHEAVPLSRGLRTRTTWVPAPVDDGRPGTVPIEPDDVVDDLLERIEATIPASEPVVVAGFSTGTSHAQAVATRLVAAGRDCALLVLLDPPGPRARPWREPARWASHLRTRFWYWRRPPGPDTPRPQVVFHEQWKAAIRWRPPQWTGPTLVVRSDQFAGFPLPPGLDGSVTVRRLAGGHFDVIAAGEELAAAIEGTLADLDADRGRP